MTVHPRDCPKEVDLQKVTKVLEILANYGERNSSHTSRPNAVSVCKSGKVDLAWLWALSLWKVGCVRVLHQFWTGTWCGWASPGYD